MTKDKNARFDSAGLRGASTPQWQPIETAPKDRFIFVWCPEDRSRWLAKWQGDRWYGVDDNGLTREAQNAVTGWTVTHWQPLPAPPSSPEKKGDN